MSDKTHHACAIEINGIGIFIKGKSGSGKTSLALGLEDYAQQKGFNASLVSDDQTTLVKTGDCIRADVPDSIKGKVELRGYGVINHPNKQSTIIQLVVQLVDDKEIERMPYPKTYELNGLDLPLLEVPIRHEAQSIRIIFAWLWKNTGLQDEQKSST